MMAALRLAAGVFAAWTGGLAAAPLSIEDAFRPGTVHSVTLSPDGKRVAAVAYANRQSALLLVDTATLKATMGSVLRGRAAPRRVRWVTSDVLAVVRPGGTHFVRPDGTNVLNHHDRYMWTLDPGPDGQEIVLMDQRDHKYYIDRLNLRTGESTT